MLEQESLEELAHELYTAAQLAPGEGIEDAVGRLVALMDTQQSSAAPQTDRQPAGEYPPLPRKAGLDDHSILPEPGFSADQMHAYVDADRASRAPTSSVLEDAARYRFLAAHCRRTSEHWGGRWSIVVDGPAPKSHDSEDDFDAAIDAARGQANNRRSRGAMS